MPVVYATRCGQNENKDSLATHGRKHAPPVLGKRLAVTLGKNQGFSTHAGERGAAEGVENAGRMFYSHKAPRRRAVAIAMTQEKTSPAAPVLPWDCLFAFVSRWERATGVLWAGQDL